LNPGMTNLLLQALFSIVFVLRYSFVIQFQNADKKSAKQFQQRKFFIKSFKLLS
jgi:hypothetical protein